VCQIVLQFVCTALLLNEIYLHTQFLVNTSCSFRVGLGRYGQQPIRYVFDTVSRRYDTYSIRTLPIRYVFDTVSSRYDMYSIRTLSIRYVFDTVSSRYDTYSIRTLQIRYVFDTDLADTIRIRYDTHLHDFWFQNQDFWISTTKWMFLGWLYTVNPSNTSVDAKWSPV